MSFSNTKSPVKPTDMSKVRYPIPMRRSKRGPMEYYIPDELLEQFKKHAAEEMTRTVMQWYGISFSTFQRFKRELGVTKDMVKVRHKQAQLTKRICEKNGYYDSLRGKAPSEQCLQAAARKRAEGFSPMKRLKEISPRKYKAALRRRSKLRKELIDTERRRYALDFIPISNLPTHIYGGVSYNRYEIHVRSFARRHGYTIGSIDPDLGERMMIYYNEQTDRHSKFEASATRRGFEFRTLHTRGKILSTIPTSNTNLLLSQD